MYRENHGQPSMCKRSRKGPLPYQEDLKGTEGWEARDASWNGRSRQRGRNRNPHGTGEKNRAELNKLLSNLKLFDLSGKDQNSAFPFIL